MVLNSSAETELDEKVADVYFITGKTYKQSIGGILVTKIWKLFGLNLNFP